MFQTSATMTQRHHDGTAPKSYINTFRYDLEESDAGEAEALLSSFMRTTSSMSQRNSLESSHFLSGGQARGDTPTDSSDSAGQQTSWPALVDPNSTMSRLLQRYSKHDHPTVATSARSIQNNQSTITTNAVTQSQRRSQSEATVSAAGSESSRKRTGTKARSTTPQDPNLRGTEAIASRRPRRAVERVENYYASYYPDLDDLDNDNSTHQAANAPVQKPQRDIPPPQSSATHRVKRGWPRGRSHLELGHGSLRPYDDGRSSGLKLYKSWKGASNDVIVLTWSPDGTRFAIGAAAQSDEHNMQYNRNNNLVIGDLTTNVLKELPDHHIPRPPHNAHATTSDPRLFMTVTALEWHGDTLYSASFDHTVRLWDASDTRRVRCSQILRHESRVEVMARALSQPNILATGTDKFGYWSLQGSPTYTPLNITSKSPLPMVATALEWGPNTASRHILVGGMSVNSPEHDIPQQGHLAVWFSKESHMVSQPIMPNSQNIFDIKWHPSLPRFITGSSTPIQKSGGLSRDTRSVVRVYEPLTAKRSTIELECPALDINDVTFCSKNSSYVTASCTDGATYVWDLRRPDEYLHKLQHDEPLNQIDENLTREQADVGVRVALWGNSASQLFTGASDGVLKLWDVLRSSENALVDNVACFDEEIMSATFSGDNTDLLIGDAAGGIHILSSAPFWDTNDMDMHLEMADEQLHGAEAAYGADSDSGIAMANALLSSGQLVRHEEYGVGQGPHYKGPFASWARPEGTLPQELAVTPLTPEWQQRQLSGPPVERRPLLDQPTRKDIADYQRLARIRNSRKHPNKRKREFPDEDRIINLVSDDDSEDEEPSVRLRYSQYIITLPGQPDIIDLTLSDSDNEEVYDVYEETLEERLEPDFWWPASEDVPANISEDEL